MASNLRERLRVGILIHRRVGTENDPVLEREHVDTGDGVGVSRGANDL